MNRRGFMKVLLGCSVGAALPVVGKAVSSRPVIDVDTAKPGADHAEMMIGRYEGVRFIESNPFGDNALYSKKLNPDSWSNSSWDSFDFNKEPFEKRVVNFVKKSKEKIRAAEKLYIESTPEGGSFYYDAQQKIKFKSHRDTLQEAMNKIASDRLDIIKTANVGPTVADANNWTVNRLYGGSDFSSELLEKLYAAKA